MHSTSAPSPRQVIQSAQATIDRIVRESPLHTLSQGMFGDDTESVLDRTVATSAIDELVYDDRESYAAMRVYHPRYTVQLEKRQTSVVAQEIWADLQKDVPHYVGIVRTYLSAMYEQVAAHVQVYIAERRAHFEESLQQFRVHLADHQAHIEARAAELQARTLHPKVHVADAVIQEVVPVVSPATPVVETILPVFEPLIDERVAIPSEVEPIAPKHTAMSTVPTTRPAQSGAGQWRVYAHAYAIVMSRIYNGHSPMHRTAEELRPNELTQQQYADIIDIGTHSEISRRFPPMAYE